MNIRSLFSLFSSDLAIDLGTANTLVFAKGKGIVVNEPSIVAINKTTGDVEAVHPRIVIGVPSEITQVEKRAFIDSAYRAKASEVHLVEQAMVAAIGAGLPVTLTSHRDWLSLRRAALLAN
jgi:rod shape-determining protein MreB and related proteins